MSKSPPPLNLPSAEPLWKQRCWKYTALFIAAVSAQGYGVISVIPRFEKLFEDLLGDRKILPMLTQWVIFWTRQQQNFFLLELLLIPILLALLWLSKGHALVRSIFAIIIVVLILYVLVAIPAIIMPYTQLMSRLSR